jgi:hypothetical protein
MMKGSKDAAIATAIAKAKANAITPACNATMMHCKK